MPVNATTIRLYRNEKKLPYNATITPTCHKGFRFHDGYVSKTIRYTDVEKRIAAVSSCQCKNTHSITNNLILLMLCVLCFICLSESIIGKCTWKNIPFTESICEPVPLVGHASPDTTLTDKVTLISDTCIPGFKYDNETVDAGMHAKCIEEEWKLKDLRCISRNILIKFRF